MNKEKCLDVGLGLVVVNAYEAEVAADLACATLRLRSVSILYINNGYGSPHSCVPWRKAC